MAFVNRHGEGVEASAPRSRRMTPEEIARTRDLHMLRLRRDGWSFVEIAAYFGVGRRTVARRIAAVPDRVKDRLAAKGLI